MAFNKQNAVEHFIIHQRSGVHLNAVQGNLVKEDAVDCDTIKWKYIQPDILQRNITPRLLLVADQQSLIF